MNSAPWVPLLLVVGACTCPPLEPGYASPADTLLTWQASLCADDPASEYGCLAADLKRSIGGFETYHAARAKLLDEEPLLAWLLERADLFDYFVASETDREHGVARLRFRVDGQAFDLIFVREVWALADFDGGRRIPERLDTPLEALVVRQGRGQWINVSELPPLGAEDLIRLQRLVFEPRWKIAGLPGLLDSVEIAP